jgi:flagellar hook-associated protein FlgK|tara:strand:- start:300 stop:533 length:234 start_codon:yes stop_codon:yes gene_type:complete
MMTIKNPTSIKNTLERLETMMKEMNAHINEIENRIIDLETQVVSDIDGMLDNIRSDIGNDIQSAISEINSNIDQLKD